ncbi:GNAT family N-acetyltransferase [Roseibium sp.]|uniref:GNAT family N-acetyltransferase n=1 Tax=Roseibium sp. TaxID=1936156 RepID=UPI003A97A114
MASKFPNDFRAEVLSDLNAYRALYQSMRGENHAMPSTLDFVYQSPGWISSWLDTFGYKLDARPLFIAIFTGNKPVLLLPLSLTTQMGMQIAEFYSQSNANQNTGVWDKELLEKFSSEDIRRAIQPLILNVLKAANADLMYLRNVPPVSEGTELPLPYTSRQKSMNPTFRGELSQGFEVMYENSMGKTSRRSLRRKEKALNESGDFRVYCAETPEEINEGLAVFFEQRQTRAELTGIPNAFESETAQAFVRNLTRQSALGTAAESTSPLLTVWCLHAADKIRATYLCLRHDACVVGYTNSIAHDDLTNKSPGVVLLRDLIRNICEEGHATVFDLGLGEERYKHGWTDPLLLSDLFLPVSFKGRLGFAVQSAITAAKTMIRSNPKLWSMVRKARSWRAKAS